MKSSCYPSYGLQNLEYVSEEKKNLLKYINGINNGASAGSFKSQSQSGRVCHFRRVEEMPTCRDAPKSGGAK